MATVAELLTKGVRDHIARGYVTLTTGAGEAIKVSLTPVKDEPRGDWMPEGAMNAAAVKSWFFKSLEALPENETVTGIGSRSFVVTSCKPIVYGDVIAFYEGTLLESMAVLV